MKKLILALMCVTSLAQAGVKTVNGSAGPTFDGSTLMIQMNKPLIIPKDQQLALDKELGKSKRNQLYTEMIMEKSVSQLRSKYGATTRPVTAQIIQKYQVTLQNNMKVVPKVGSL
ncbi:MAG: hypothetical protein H7256_09020 [Bdellovibrio sp.]|nr:hypothetical protein [Bdellovibrio sp.]